MRQSADETIGRDVQGAQETARGADQGSQRQGCLVGCLQVVASRYARSGRGIGAEVQNLDADREENDLLRDRSLGCGRCLIMGRVGLRVRYVGERSMARGTAET